MSTASVRSPGAMPARHLVVMAAGTGGHIIPGLAVATEMMSRGWTISWLGTTHGMENRLVPPSGIALDTVAFSGLRGKGAVHSATGGFRLVGAFLNCLRILQRRGADAVLGMGGYVCFPGGMAAWLARKPLMLVNADASLLLSNRSLLKVCERIGFGFDGETARSTPKAVVTGNPVRSEIEAIAPPAERFAGRVGPFRLLVVGGSLGAKALNDCLPAALALVPEAQRPHVIHQTGTAHHASVVAAYQAAGVTADVRPFIQDMAPCLSDCDVIVCRAGAVTVSELCTAGVASVLVPLVVSTTSHQRDNAAWMARHDAAVHLPQPQMTPDSVAKLLMNLSRSDLLAMAQRARALALPHAAARVADEIERMVAA